MCNTQTVAKVLNGVVLTLDKFGSVEGLSENPEFQQIEKQLSQVAVDLQNWKKGDPAQNIITVLVDVEAGFKLLPVPEEDKQLADIILAGITTIIGMLDYNGTPVTESGATPSDQEIKEHQSEVAMSTLSTVRTLVPGFRWHKGFIGLFRENPEHAYFDQWNSTTKEHGEKWASAHIDY